MGLPAIKYISIDSLQLSNFKGVSSLIVKTNGLDMEIRGNNATCKTTIYDAYMWLLTGKDSHGKTDFQLKPVDTDGNEVHNLETEVEGTLSIDGKSIVLKKRYQEKWTKKKGSAKQEFEGHTTDHFWDGVPVRKKEFDAKIKRFTPETFSIISNPYEFNNIHWQERRKILLEMCGGVSDQDVINTDPGYSKLSQILNGSSIDDHRKKTNEARKKINKELDQIPVRIAELQRNQDLPKIDEKEKHALQDGLKSEKENLQSIQNNSFVSKKQIEINKIESKIIEIKNSAPDVSKDRKKVSGELTLLESKYREHENKIIDLKHSIKEWEKRRTLLKDTVETLRNDYHRLNDKKVNIDETCPTCGQEIPSEQIQIIAKENFNQDKAKKLSEINKEGKKQAESVKVKEKDIKDATKTITEHQTKLADIQVTIDKKYSELKKIKPKIDTKAIQELEQEKQAIQKKIDELNKGTFSQEKEIKKSITEITLKLDQIATVEAEIRADKKRIERIKELEGEEKKLATEFERLESELDLIDRFVVSRVNMLEDQSNSRFSLAKFKLFETQINGGIVECCETLFQGVPYNKGLNTGSKINVGLDIINNLSEFYEFSAPIFIDNAESVTSIIDTTAQQIRLIVDESCQEIKTEIKTKIQTAA